MLKEFSIAFASTSLVSTAHAKPLATFMEQPLLSRLSGNWQIVLGGLFGVAFLGTIIFHGLTITRDWERKKKPGIYGMETPAASKATSRSHYQEAILTLCLGALLLIGVIAMAVQWLG